jgi:hypothetical protein
VAYLRRRYLLRLWGNDRLTTFVNGSPDDKTGIRDREQGLRNDSTPTILRRLVPDENECLVMEIPSHLLFTSGFLASRTAKLWIGKFMVP